MHRRNLLLLLLLSFGHLVVDLHSGSLPSLFPVLSATYALTYTEIGLLMLVSQITSSVVQPVFGVASDRVSTRWLLPVSLAVTTIGLLIIGHATSYCLVVAGVVIMGLGIAAYHPEASKLVYYVGGEEKGRAMSMFALGGNIGIGFGPALMAVGLSLLGMKGAWLFVPVTMAAVILVQKHLGNLYAHVETTHSAGSENGGARTATRSPIPWGSVILLLVIIFLRSGTHASLLAFTPMYFTDILGYSETASSMVLTAFLLAGAFGTYFGGPASDRVGPRSVIAVSLIASAPLVALLAWTADGTAAVVLVTFIGFTLISSFAVTTVLGQALLGNNVGLASGLTLGFSVGTGGISATALGWVADRWSLAAALLVIAFMTLLGGILALFLPRVSRQTDSVREEPGRAGRDAEVQASSESSV